MLVVRYVNSILIVIYDLKKKKKGHCFSAAARSSSHGAAPLFSEDGGTESLVHNLRASHDHRRPFVRPEAQCVPAEGACFVYVSRRIKEEFKV